MKLIIDIPDNVLKSRQYCLYFGAWSTKLTETIENGIPYEERPQGEWIKKYRGQVNSFCSECDYEAGRKTNFCPNCGARLLKGGSV